MDFYLMLENRIKKEFPEFELTENMIGLPTVVFSFLAIYISDCIDNKKNEIIDRFVIFTNELCDISNNNSIVDSCLDEVVLGLFSTSEKNYNEFESKLSVKCKTRFKETVDLWNEGNFSK